MSLHTLENIRMRGDQEPVTQFTTRIFFVFAGDVKCQHRRAVTYFTESIRQSCPMIGVSCPSYGEFIDVSFLFRHWFQNGTIGMLCVSLSYYTYILWPNANTMKGLHFYNMLLYLTGWLLGLRRWTPLFIHGLGRRASALTTPANQALSTYMGTQPILWYVPYHYRRETQIYFYVLHYMLLLFSRFFFSTVQRWNCILVLAGYHYRVTVEFSNSTEAQEKMGEFGIIHLRLTGNKDKSPPIKLSEKWVTIFEEESGRKCVYI